MKEKNLKLTNLFNDGLSRISKSSSEYNSFLKTAAHNFRMSFNNAVVAYAQKTNTDLLLTYDQWQLYGRVPKRYSKRVFLFDNANARRYVIAYGYSSTVKDKRIKEPKREISFFDYKNNDEVLNAVKAVFQSEEITLDGVIYQETLKRFENYFDDAYPAFENEKEFLTKSVTNMMMSRFGEDIPFNRILEPYGINQERLPNIFHMAIDVFREEYSELATSLPVEIERQRAISDETRKPYQIITNAGIDGGFDEKLEFATLDEAINSGNDYISDGYLGFSVYNTDTKRIEYTYGDFDVTKAYSEDVLIINNLSSASDKPSDQPIKAQTNPIWEEYINLKKENPDVIILYQVGDFYEALGDDAHIVSEQLELFETHRLMPDGEQVPLCGMPYHSLDNYSKMLLDKGYDVGIASIGENKERQFILMNSDKKQESVLSEQDILLEKANELISDYMDREFGEDNNYVLPKDLSNINLAYTTTEDEKHEITADLNLVDFRIETKVDNKVVRTEQYESLQDIVDNGLDGMSFDDLIYLSDEELAPFYDETAETVLLPEKIPTEEVNNIVSAEKPMVQLTQRDIDNSIILNPSLTNGKLRVYAAFDSGLEEKRIVRVVRREYKNAAKTIHTENGLSYYQMGSKKELLIGDYKGEYAPLRLSYEQLYKRIKELIDANKYLNDSELSEYRNQSESTSDVPSLREVDFKYSVGDTASINGTSYVVSDVSDYDVTVYQADSPLFIEKYPKELFDEILRQNIEDNKKLIEKPKTYYELFQLNRAENNHRVRFMSLEQLKELGLEVNRDNYEKVYSGELQENENLDTLYERFNIHHPADFKGHSMSVSDVVVLTTGGEVKAYYCDSFAFTEIPNFLSEQQLQEYILLNPDDRTVSWVYYNPDGNDGSGQIVHEVVSVDELSQGIQAVPVEELSEFFSKNGVQHIQDIENSKTYVSEYEEYLAGQPSGLKYSWNSEMSAEDYEAFKNMIRDFAAASQVVNQPEVVINFSEHPALYDFSHKKTRLRFSFANELLGRLDMLENAKRENPEVGFYYKTDFTIYSSADGIHSDTYSGRYDLADGETNIIGHIDNFISFSDESFRDADKKAYNALLERLNQAVIENPLTKSEEVEIERIVTQDYGLDNDTDTEVEPKAPEHSDLIGKEVEYSDKRFRVKSTNQFGQAHLEDISSLSDGNVPIDTVLPVETVKNLIDNQSINEAENFVITDNNIGVGTPLQRFNNNIAALKVLNNIQNENRPANHSEQLVLSQYVGWGGLSDFFNDHNVHNQELRQLLSDIDYESAYDSVLTSFYTPPVVIKSMYKALNNLGFTNGSILDPACGTGHFFGMLPDYLQNGTRLYGIEIDNVSGRIAKALYPNANIKVMGFEETNIPDNYIDVVVGNVPFGDFQVYDPKYNKNHLLIHDYFFIKSLDKVRPGGIVAFITSKGTLDKSNTKVREMIADRADLLGAIRLPNNTFKSAAGTEVTSDIIFLQKHLGAELSKEYPDWVYTSTTADGIEMNNYFIAHPEMVCGKMVLKSTRFSMDGVCIPNEGVSLNDELNNAIKHIQGSYIPYTAADESEDISESIVADEAARNHSYYVKDDTVYYRENGVMTVSPYKGRKADRIIGMVKLADVTRALIEAEYNGESDDVVSELRDRLNTVYDDFYNEFGSINSLANAVFKNDNSYCLLCSLEKITSDEITEETVVEKADIFTKRTISPHIEIVSADTSEEALIISVSQKGKVDLDYMSSLTGNSTDQIIQELNGTGIFLKPYEGEYVTADEYLSGNVREKLKTAQMAAKEDEKYQVNVNALEKIQPTDIPASEISVRLGTTWIPEKYYNDFLKEIFKPAYDDITVQFNPMMGNFFVTGKSLDNFSVESVNRFGTKDRNGYKILEDSLNLKTSEVRETKIINGKETSVVNREKTLLVQNKQEILKNKFKEWIFKEPERRRTLERIYNDKFNCLVPRQYDGSHLTFSGINPNINLREHQLNAIARMLYGGNTLLAHQVGAGKTFEMCAGAMKLKELGLAHKSLICVPKHLTSQTGAEFLRLFPAANILVAEEKDFTPKNRKRFCSRIATGDYDAIIIGHTQLEKIPLKPETQFEILNQQLDEIVDAIEEAQEKGLAKATVKSLAQSRKTVEKKLKELKEKSLKKDDVIYFEELGVDQIFVDEAHLFKNLFIYTKMTNVAGVSSGRESGRASDLYSKINYLNQISPGKGVVFATGTPIANSISEMYIMQRYLQPQMLKSMGLMHFDSWATTFGETVTSLEIAPEGSGYRAKTRFAKFNNIPELMAMFKEVADIQTSETLKLPVPDVKREIVEVSPTEEQKKMIEKLGERAERIRLNKIDPRKDNILKIINDGKMIALDPRIFDSDSSGGSKITDCAKDVFETWKKSTDNVQLVFCDISTPSTKNKKSKKYNVYDDLKQQLVEYGIPENEVQFAQDYHSSNSKKQFYADIRSGKIRVVVASTELLGTGANIQDRLIKLHHLDPTKHGRPCDFEQREGRIIRLGNLNPFVTIRTYVTKGTFDAFMYQMIERKQKFVSSVMTAKHYSERSVDDIDEATLNYGQIKAVASDNPLVMRKFEIDNQVNKLTSIRNDFINQQRQMEDEVQLILPQKIHKLQVATENYKADLAFAEQHPEPEEFDIEIAGKHYDSRSDALEAIVVQSKRLNGNELLDVGTYRGFKLYLYKEATWNNSVLYDLCMTVKNQAGYRVKIEPSKGVGNLVRINNAISHTISEKYEEAVNEISILQNRLEAAKAELNQEFPQESEYQALLKEQSEINIELTVGENKSNADEPMNTKGKDKGSSNDEAPSANSANRPLRR